MICHLPFFFNDTATTEIYTLSLHDALPILWESNFQPVVVDDFCAVRAHFHEPIQNVVHEILITPKMSFGTGHHATTYMMRSEEHTSELQSRQYLVCRLLLEKKKMPLLTSNT